MWRYSYLSCQEKKLFFPALGPFTSVMFVHAFVFVKGKFCLWKSLELTLVSLFSTIRCVHIHLWSWHWELLWSHSWNILRPQNSGECVGRKLYMQYVLTNCSSLEGFCSQILKISQRRAVQRQLCVSHCVLWPVWKGCTLQNINLTRG